MAYSVTNGAVRKSPLIDKMNQLPVAQVKRMASKQMEQLVFGHRNKIYPPIPVSFDACKKEVKTQLHRYQNKR